MNFELTEEQQRLREATRRFVQKELPDLARHLEETDQPVSEAWRRRYAEMGFLGVNIAPSYGGLGLGDFEAILVLEEFAKISPAVAFPVFESSVGPIRAIEHFGHPNLRARVIPPVCRGEAVVAVAMSEPDAGTALTDLKTRADISASRIVLQGQKRWCSGGSHADGYLVYCRLSSAPGAAGIGAVYVDKDRPGVSFGNPERLMGFRGIPSADIFLDHVEVPLDHLVVPAGGFKNLMRAFDLERCGNATMCLGIAEAALQQALSYTQERRQFGKPLVDFQAVQLKLAEMAMQVEAARLLIYRGVQPASPSLPSAYDSSLAKCFANEMVRQVCGNALQVMGGYGYSKQYSMEQRLRDAWGWGIAGGAIDIQKVNIAAEIVGRRFPQRAT